MISQPECLVSNLPNCGIVAIATLTDKNASVVYNHFKEWFGKQNNWRGRTTNKQRLEYLDDLNYHCIPIKFEKQTLKSWVTQFSIPSVKYMINITGHVVAVQNQIVVDQHETSHVSEHNSKQKQIRNIHIVCPM